MNNEVQCGVKNIIWGQVIQKKAKYAHTGVVIYSFIANGGAQGSERRLLLPHWQADKRAKEEAERETGSRERKRGQLVFPAGGAGQTHNIFFSARWKMRHGDPTLFFFFSSSSSYSSSLSSIPHLHPVLPPPSGQLEWQCAAGDLGAAGNRRTLHTRAAHLTHTYKSLKLKCWQTLEHECSGSALERTRMAVLRAYRGHLAHKGQCKHSCRMFTSRLSSLSWAQSLLPLSVAP